MDERLNQEKIILSQNDVEDIQRFVTDIEERQFPTVLTNELIYLAKMEEGGSKIPLIALPFSDLVEETAQSFQALAIMENKIFQVNIQEMMIIRGEEQALRKLVSILLDNAVKYSSENGSILLTLEKSGKTIRLAVENTVRNMSAETVSHLLNVFTGKMHPEIPAKEAMG